MTPFAAEIIGTMLLLLLGNGVVANVVLTQTKGHGGGWLLINFGYGLAVFTAVLVSMDFSGAHLNPAVTVGLALAGKFAWAQVAPYVLAQCIGAAIGNSLVYLIFRDHYAVTEDQGLKLATFSTSPAIRNNWSNLLSELIGTFVLVFAVLFITGPNFIASDPTVPAGLGSLGALPVALIVVVIGAGLGGTTGYAINPARDLGPRIMHSVLPIPNKGTSEWDYAWIPILGPLLGASLAAALFLVL
ncbi:MAG: aquaporin family protein [Saprospiraceae bacterium]|nr:aquaporin family protein [Saprospiraceae bacterium]